MNTQNKLILALCASLVVLLQACSSDPSPWSQSSSPWAAKEEHVEEMPADQMEPLAQDQEPEMMDAEPANEIVYAPVEPLPIEPAPVKPVVEYAPQEEMAGDVGSDLASMPAQHFTVQVCASRTMKQLKAFAKRHGLSDELTAQTTVKGETWFVLLHGVYPNRAEARQALAGVPQVGTKPWVRTVGSLQAVMTH